MNVYSVAVCDTSTCYPELECSSLATIFSCPDCWYSWSPCFCSCHPHSIHTHSSPPSMPNRAARGIYLKHKSNHVTSCWNRSMVFHYPWSKIQITGWGLVKPHPPIPLILFPTSLSQGSYFSATGFLPTPTLAGLICSLWNVLQLNLPHNSSFQALLQCHFLPNTQSKGASPNNF